MNTAASESTGRSLVRRYGLRTAFGPMVCGWTDRGLAVLEFATAGKVSGLEEIRDQEGERGRVFLRELGEYSRTGRVRFRTRVDLSAGSAFQRAAWQALRRIPPGRVRAYGQIARDLGRPGAARAVGGACGRNPVVILVPCHRVVASNGLGGFGAGPARKRRLLSLEGVSA